MERDPEEPRDKVVYVWLDKAGAPRYVGKGSVGRAFSHADGSHNPGLHAWLDKEPNPDLKIAGPYTDRESLIVEAALISALSETKVPLFNEHPGNGPRFRRTGVPEEKSDRLGDPPLGQDDIARMTSGALFVMTPSAFKPLAPLSDQAVEDIALAVEESWQLGTFIEGWRLAPESGPQVVVGVSGPIGRRFVIGAFAIDTARWGEPSMRVGRLWRVPLVDRTEADAAGLQGRRVADAKFGNAKHLHFHWFDAEGVFHPYVGKSQRVQAP